MFTHFHTFCSDHPDNKALSKLHATMGHPPDFSKGRWDFGKAGTKGGKGDDEKPEKDEEEKDEE